MVLVDTSVWIRFLGNRSPYAQEMDRLLALDEVAGHELIYGELLVGDRGTRRTLFQLYEVIQTVSPVSHREAVEFVRSRKLEGRGIGWFDIHLLASALVSRVCLWTADLRLAAIAGELGIGY